MNNDPIRRSNIGKTIERKYVCIIKLNIRL